jgi:hypothetical protein
VPIHTTTPATKAHLGSGKNVLDTLLSMPDRVAIATTNLPFPPVRRGETEGFAVYMSLTRI